jgi:hypothetical protein
MSLQTRAVVGVAVVLGFIFFTNSGKNSSSGLTNDDVNGIILEVERGFEKAEKEILGKPSPEPDKPIGPDPDPKKCICKGTGRYERPDAPGSGKMVECPFHGSKDVPKCEHEYVPQKTQRRGIFGGRLFGR